MKNVRFGYEHRDGLFFAMGVHNAMESFALDSFEGFLESKVEELGKYLAQMLSFGDHFYLFDGYCKLIDGFTLFVVFGGFIELYFLASDT